MLVEGVAEEIVATVDRERVLGLGLFLRDVVAEHEPTDRDARSDDQERDPADGRDLEEAGVVDFVAGGDREPILDPAVHRQAGDDGEDREKDERDGHACRRLVRFDVLLPALVAEEGHHHEAGHVERGDARAEDGQRAEDLVAVPGGHDDVVLRVEARGERESDDRQVTHGERQEGDLHRLRERTEVAHVHVIVHCVHDGARTEEHVGLEEAVGDEVEDRECCTDGAEACGEHHVADLRHRRAREYLLDVVLAGTDDGTGEQGDRTDDRDGERRFGRLRVDRVRADHEVDASGDHGRGMDEGRHRGGAFHRVEQPGLERDLRRLATCCEQQEEADQCRPATHLRSGGVDVGEADGTDEREHREHRDREAEVTDTVDDERLVAGCRCGIAVSPERDQQERREADAFPTHEEDEVAVREHEREHRRDE